MNERKAKRRVTTSRAMRAGMIACAAVLMVGVAAALATFSFTQTTSSGSTLPSNPVTATCTTPANDATYDNLSITGTAVTGYMVYDCSGSSAFAVSPGGSYSVSVAGVATPVTSVAPDTLSPTAPGEPAATP